MYFNSAFRKTLLGTTNSIAAVATTTTITAASSSLVSTGLYLNTITVTHALSVGQTVVIAGASPTAYNGTFTVRSVTGTTSFTVYSSVDGGTWSSGGTATGLATSTLLAATATATGALSAGQLGIYNQNFGAINYTTAADKTPFYLVQGSYFTNDKIGSHGGYQESVKSKMINPKYISRIFWVQSKTPQQQVVQLFSTPTVSGGNVGLNADTTYRLRIDVKGSPALRFLSHNIYRVMDSYTGPLNATNPTYVKDPIATLVDWKEQLTMSPYFNQLVQARVYVYKGSIGAASSSGINSWGTPTTTSTTLTFNLNNATGVVVGQRITGTNMPANSFITAVASTATATHNASGVTIGTSTYVATTGGSTFSSSPGVGAVVSGAGFPVGSYVSATGTTAFTITYPTQAVAPTISGIFTASISCTVTYPTQPSAPSLATTNVFKVYNDVYGANGGYTIPYTNIAVTSGQQPTYVGQTPYIPGASTYNTTGTYPSLTQDNVKTGATITAASTLLASTSGAHIYTASADAASFTYTAGQEPFIELTAAYFETKFGNSTFTVTDNYDLEPLKIIASLMDDSGSTTVTAPIGQGYTASTNTAYATIGTIGDAGIAYVAQASSMAQGTGETVLRELILTGRYRQEAFGDGTNIDQFRMREAEANPGVLNMMTVANRNSLYNKLCILHSVPRFNNPTGVFDNDQYLIEIAVPSAVPLSNIFNTATYVSGGTIAGAAGIGLGDYILEASIAAGGAQFAEMI